MEDHLSDVTGVAFSPDGTPLASGSWDKKVQVYDVSDWTVLHTLKNRPTQVNSLAFSPDGTLLAVGCARH